MTRTIPRRALIALVTASALTAACLVGSSAATASTLFACVKKNGTAHLYSKKPKCKKGEKKLTWSNVGPAGKNGVNGANGTNGANGSNGAAGASGDVAGYFSSQPSGLFLTSTLTKLSGLERTLPAGSYLLSASVGIEGFAESAGSGAQEECQLIASSGPKSVSKWAGPFLNVSGQFIAEGELTMQLGVTAAEPVTVSVKCRQTLGIGTGLEVVAHRGTLSAIHAASIS
jgi:hypothetical protein